MAEVLLINPARRKRRKSNKSPSPAQRRARAAFAAAARARSRNPHKRRAHRARVHRRNPISTLATRLTHQPRRRRNPVHHHRVHHRTHRRRRNPIAMPFSVRGLMAQFQNALIGGAGSVAMDMLMQQLNRFLPIGFQKVEGLPPDMGDAVKAVLTVVAGNLLRGPTRGLSVRMAQGALTVQAAGLIKQLLPAGFGGLGFYSPAQVTQGVQRVGPIRKGVNAYMRPGVTPMLNGMGAYMRPGASPLLSGGSSYSSNAREREGVSNLR